MRALSVPECSTVVLFPLMIPYFPYVRLMIPYLLCLFGRYSNPSFSSRIPTKNKRYTFMHNGGIPGFCGMKRQLLSLLGDEAYKAIEGTTDSEVKGGRCIGVKI